MSVVTAKASGHHILDGGNVTDERSSYILNPIALHENFWNYSLVVVERTEDATITTSTATDANLYVMTSGSTYGGVEVVISSYGDVGTVSLTSSNEAIATVTGMTAWAVTNGTVTLTIADSESIRSESITYSATVSVNTGTNIVTAGVATTLRHDLTASIDARLFYEGLNLTTEIKQFTNSLETGGADTVYTRNPNFWLSGVDFSSLSPMNETGIHSQGGAARGGVAISKRFVACVGHYRLWEGWKIWFIGTDDVVYERTVMDYAIAGGGQDGICVALLDADLPDEVSIAKVLPTDVGLRLSRDGQDLPMICFDQFREATVRDIKFTSTHVSSLNYNGDGTPHVIVLRQNAEKGSIPFDSGSPGFLLLNWTPVLVGIVGTSSTLWSVLYYHDAINTAMSALWAENNCSGSAQQLTDVDISSYPLLTAL
jgi:hypothetical protein